MKAPDNEWMNACYVNVSIAIATDKEKQNTLHPWY
jgi:hypothetical protein